VRLALLAAALLATAAAVPRPPFAGKSAPVQQAQVVEGARPVDGRYEYVFLDGEIDVYREGSPELAERILVPATAAGTRGIAVDPSRHLLYIAYGGDGGAHGTGSLLQYDLLRDRVVWQRNYPIGIDSFALSPDGRTIFMPNGEAEAAPFWYVIRATTGRAVARIAGGSYPHNTVVSLDGRRVYLGPRGDNFLTVADAHTLTVVRRIGPLRESERPFTINGRQTLAFTTASNRRGFEVASIRTGRVLYTIDFGPVPVNYPLSAPTHGISLSPDEKQLWVIDSPADAVRVFDVTHLPPRQIAVLEIPPMATDEVGCAYDCLRSGWLQHTLDGKFVYAGDTGEVFATDPPRLAFSLPTLRNTRKHIEIDWRNGRPVATSTRAGLGRVR
jgi:DNA-binding beta-propeller fold protein YncE